MTEAVLLALFGFFMGSLPFSYWIGRYGLKQDIRQVGDGNPGATNVLRAGGRKWAMVAAVLDGLKGTIPVGLAHWRFGMTDAALVLVALSPVLGHAFSPFLKFKGGKAVAVTFGIWAGITLWQVPTVMGLLLFLWVKLIRVSGLAVVLMLISTLVYLLIFRPEPALIGIMLGLILILGWKHRGSMRRPQPAPGAVPS
jgi:glycerol-3-phosphate acyltransferase PlsY